MPKYIWVIYPDRHFPIKRELISKRADGYIVTDDGQFVNGKGGRMFDDRRAAIDYQIKALEDERFVAEQQVRMINMDIRKLREERDK